MIFSKTAILFLSLAWALVSAGALAKADQNILWIGKIYLGWQSSLKQVAYGFHCSIKVKIIVAKDIYFNLDIEYLYYHLNSVQLCVTVYTFIFHFVQKALSQNKMTI